MAHTIALIIALSWFFTSSLASTVFLLISSLDNPDLHRSSDWGSLSVATDIYNASIWFTFTGTGLTVMLRTGQSHGKVAIEVDGEETIHDASSAEQASLCAICDAALTYGLHNVTLTNTGPSEGTAASWMYIDKLSYVEDDSLISSTAAASTTSPDAEGTSSSGMGFTTSSASVPASSSDPSSSSSKSTATTSSMTTPTSSLTKSPAKPRNVAVLVGCVVGGILAGALVIAFATCLARRRRGFRRLHAPPPDGRTLEEPPATVNGGAAVPPSRQIASTAEKLRRLKGILSPTALSTSSGWTPASQLPPPPSYASVG